MTDLALLGSPGSPYTRKMLALLRYRRIRYRMVWGSHFYPPQGYPTPKVKLLPTFYFPTEQGPEAVVDSTPIIERLEAMHPERSVLPDDPVLRFLALLVEDFADEWLTKAMFHYRWHYAADATNAGALLTFWQDPTFQGEEARRIAQSLAQRQTARLPMVGSNGITQATIEASYLRLIHILDGIVSRHGFVCGQRPSAADFALYGQLTQLGLVDPTPSQELQTTSPRLRAWLDRLEDLSGHDATAWLDRADIVPHLGELLAEIGRVYLPFLLANRDAIQQGHTDWTATIDGRAWTQPVFPYQLKCLQTLQAARLALSADDRALLDEVLTAAGCDNGWAR
jgi:glutathione S-transferase